MGLESQVIRARLHLMGELRSGTRRPGAPISVKETATALNVSHTPVREALAGLVGEGAVTVVGGRNGFAVPRLGMRGFVDLIELVQLMVHRILANSPATPHSYPSIVQSFDEPTAAVEATISWIVGTHGNPQIVRAIGRAGTILAPYRRVEPSVVPGWLHELQHVHAEIAAGRWEPAMQSYWQTRIDLAGAIVDAVEHGGECSNIFQI